MCDKEEKDDFYAIWRGDPFLRYNEVTEKHEIVVNESVFRYDHTGEDMREAYSNEVILDYDADDKTIFEYKLKGNTESNSPEHP